MMIKILFLNVLSPRLRNFRNPLVILNGNKDAWPVICYFLHPNPMRPRQFQGKLRGFESLLDATEGRLKKAEEEKEDQT
jgi:hypothetical protein